MYAYIYLYINLKYINENVSGTVCSALGIGKKARYVLPEMLTDDFSMTPIL